MRVRISLANLLLMIGLLTLAACGAEEASATPVASPTESAPEGMTTPSPEPTATAEEMMATSTPEPTAITEPTAEPTATSEPTAEPTATVEPTAAATATPEPTAQPTAAAEPTAEPTAITEPTEEPAPTPETVQVTMVDVTFQPQQITVNPGTTVIWINEDSFAHTVTSGTRDNPTNLFDSGSVAAGGTFSFTFEEPGTYDYFCEFHPGMEGVVVVEG